MVQVDPPARAAGIGTTGPAEAGKARAASSRPILFGRIARDVCIFQSDRDRNPGGGIQAAAGPVPLPAPRGGTADGSAAIAAAAAEGLVVFNGRRSSQGHGSAAGINAAADGVAAVAAVAAAGEFPLPARPPAAHGLAVKHIEEVAVGDRPAAGVNAATGVVSSVAAVAALLPEAAGAAVASIGDVAIECKAGQRRLARAAAAYEQAAADSISADAAAGRTGAAAATGAAAGLAILITVPLVEVKDVAVIVLAKMPPPLALPPAAPLPGLAKLPATPHPSIRLSPLNFSVPPAAPCQCLRPLRSLPAPPLVKPVPLAPFSNSWTPPSTFRVPLLKMAPPSADVPEPSAEPPCSSIFFKTSEPPEPGAISRADCRPGVPSTTLPLPLMVRVEATVLPMTGNPFGPLVLLFTPV